MKQISARPWAAGGEEAAGHVTDSLHGKANLSANDAAKLDAPRVIWCVRIRVA
eukprot:CAMPEP_0117683208 /NCGR_PEP_ID=MMETSP0804-20121206/20229_1 /TAXON_ID=1074897 /ORGANISM="Tetraselmis astigmatica, Strain CCMP880" /LENGTH=52 /DNA_ID=CAMNT_0005493689 /DNA_START=419 /DNA_END=573 /DNA_ORIENTATION=-